MKTKIVLWGANEADEKLLIGIELVDKENKVLIHKIPEAAATEEVYKMMMDSWRDGKEMTWPVEKEEIIRELSVAEGLLPDDIKVERTDVISRAKAEWHFVVLSSKLYEMYNGEVEDFKKTADTEFKKKSKAVTQEFREKLAVIDEKIEKGLGFKPIFEELKKLQGKVKDAAFTRDDRNAIWKKIDKSFKTIKEKRFGEGGSSNNNAKSRLEGRYNGLISAINRMEGSIRKDVQEKNFQNKRINTTDGQLEAQIRQAKLVMIDERINSKQVKLDDMLKTKLKKAADTIAATKKKRAEKAAANQAPKSTGEKVDELLTSEAPKGDEKSEGKKEVQEEPKEESLLGAITATMGEAIENVSDTVKAISTVVTDKVEDKVDEVKATLSDDDNGGEGSGSLLDAVKDAISDTIEKVKDAGESVVDVVEDKMEEEKVGDKAKSLMDTVTATVEDAVDKMKEAGTKVVEEIEEKVDDVKETLTDTKEIKSEAKTETKTAAKAGGIMGALTGMIDDVVDAAKELSETVSDKIDEVTGEEE